MISLALLIEPLSLSEAEARWRDRDILAVHVYKQEDSVCEYSYKRPLYTQQNHRKAFMERMSSKFFIQSFNAPIILKIC